MKDATRSRATSNRVRGSRAASYEGLFAMIEPLGDFQHDIRLYDTEEKARAVAKMRYHDTGRLCQVYKLVTP